jgi:hypothetical protein
LKNIDQAVDSILPVLTYDYDIAVPFLLNGKIHYPVKIIVDKNSLPLLVVHITYLTNLTLTKLFETIASSDSVDEDGEDIESALAHNYGAGDNNWKLLKWELLGKG